MNIFWMPLKYQPVQYHVPPKNFFELIKQPLPCNPFKPLCNPSFLFHLSLGAPLFWLNLVLEFSTVLRSTQTFNHIPRFLKGSFHTCTEAMRKSHLSSSSRAHRHSLGLRVFRAHIPRLPSCNSYRCYSVQGLGRSVYFMYLCAPIGTVSDLMLPYQHSHSFLKLCEGS